MLSLMELLALDSKGLNMIYAITSGGHAGGGGRIFHGHGCIVQGNELTTDILVTRVKP